MNYFGSHYKTSMNDRYVIFKYKITNKMYILFAYKSIWMFTFNLMANTI